MSRIRISHFGPINTHGYGHDGWIDIKKVTVFIGEQGCGKSSVAKLVSLCTWIEKVLTRRDYGRKGFTSSDFKGFLSRYHRLTNYFMDGKTEIEYEGDAYRLRYTKEGNLLIGEMPSINKYPLPQIAYIPAERNLITTLNNPDLVKECPGSLVGFLAEYARAKKAIANELMLPINDALLDYDQESDILSIKGRDYKVRLQESASGFQSVVPLYLVSKYLSESVLNQARPSNKMRVDEMAPNKMSVDEMARFQNEVILILNNKDLTEEQRQLAISALAARFNKSAFINIVEEPEQNLYPSSQVLLLQSLLQFNNALSANKLIVTTHSPYLVNHLAVAVKAHKLKNAYKDIADKINEIYPLEATVSPDDLAIYQHDANDNYFYALKQYKGIPSDENLLNVQLDESNDRYASLLEIEQRA